MEKTKVKQLLLKILVSTALFILLFSKINIYDILYKIKSANLNYFPLILLLIILNYFVSSIRWKKLLIFNNTEKITVKYLTSLYFIGSFFNNFMPTSVGGDVYKVIQLGKKIDSKSHAFAATFMERFLGVIALAIISLFSLAKDYGILALIAVILFILGCYVGYKFLEFASKKITKLKKLIDALKAYKGQTSVVTFAFIFSFLVQIFSILSQYFIFLSLGAAPPFMYAFLALPVITLAGFFIPSLNGIGVQDALYVSMFSLVGINGETALTASVLYHVSRLFVSMIGGILYALGMDQ